MRIKRILPRVYILARIHFADAFEHKCKACKRRRKQAKKVGKRCIRRSERNLIQEHLSE